MEGPDSRSLFDPSDNKLLNTSGILPRTAVFIQKEIKRLKDFKELSIEVSALELYCEQIKDLLWNDKKEGSGSVASTKASRHKAQIENGVLQIVSSTSGGCTIQG